MKRAGNRATWNIQAELVPIWFLPYLLVPQEDANKLSEVYKKAMKRYYDMEDP
ncbi:MAG: hypothetical protein M9900_09890 [Flavobacteriales bacterium]|nr:hypothetical protein [Flavobacteriales bacterium]